MNISIIGSGTWGSALAETLAKHHHVILFSFFKDEIDNIASTRIVKNLPYMRLDDSIVCTSDISLACSSEILIFAVPSIYIHNTAAAVKPYIKDSQIIVDVAKGIEKDSLYTMSEVIKSVLPNNKVVALSGPTHAEEVARNLPTTIVAASEDESIAKLVADLFYDSCIRAYTNNDIKGIELCGALKNVIALFCGIANGLGYGDNLKAAIMTRGMNEIVRIGRAIGCKEQTFYGLAGIGDLIVTATSEHSRNNRCGKLIGQGKSVEEAIKEVGMVVEGLNALDPAVKLANKYHINMSIIEALHRIVYENSDPKLEVDNMMRQQAKSEIDKTEIDNIFIENTSN